MTGPNPITLILNQLCLTPGDVEPLRRFVLRESRERSAESFTRLMNELNRRIFDLVNSSSVAEKICGITVIDNLIDVQYEENETKIIRFANYLRMTVSSSDPTILEKASVALGHLARAGGTLTPDFVEFEVKRALEWLEGDRYEHRRLAAVLVLKELADNVPTLFNQHVSTFINHIWVALHDPLLSIRQTAVKALRSTLHVIQKRGCRWRVQWYAHIWAEAKKGLSLANPDTIHGSLLTVQELLQTHDDFMIARFKETCELTLSFRDHRSAAVREAVIQTLPILTKYCTEAFSRAYLDAALDHIIDNLQGSSASLNTSQHNTFQDLAFVAVGDIAVSVGDRILPRLPIIVRSLRSVLNVKSKKQTSSAACLSCLGSLAVAVGPSLLPYISAERTVSNPHEPALLELAFRSGLSQPLVDALAKIVGNIPQLLDPIQARLMSCLLSILTSEEHPSSSHTKRSSNLYHGLSMLDHLDAAIEIANSAGSVIGSDTPFDMISLGLQTLGAFNLNSIDFSS